MRRRLGLLASIGLVVAVVVAALVSNSGSSTLSGSALPSGRSVSAIGAAPTAGAATVTARPESYGTGSAYVVRVSASPGQRNQVVVTLNGVIRVVDAVPLEAGEGCLKEADGAVACDPTVPGTPFVYVETGDLDDNVRFDIGSQVVSVHIDGGDGDDVLVGGGTGENFFTGGNGNDRMVGGGGRNEFLEGASANGSDRFERGAASFPDSVRYDARKNGVRVTLDGEANDGEPGEQDFVSPSVYDVYAGGGPDVLVGNERSNGLIGAGGADVLRGGAGNDQLIGGNRPYGRVGSNDRLYGGAGADRLQGNAGDDLLFGGPGQDYLEAFSGADRLLPGTGRDAARGGPGDDRIAARDGTVDTVACGRGDDRVRNDRVDRLTRTCEHHDRGRRLR